MNKKKKNNASRAPNAQNESSLNKMSLSTTGIVARSYGSRIVCFVTFTSLPHTIKLFRCESVTSRVIEVRHNERTIEGSRVVHFEMNLSPFRSATCVCLKWIGRERVRYSCTRRAHNVVVLLLLLLFVCHTYHFIHFRLCDIVRDA